MITVRTSPAYVNRVRQDWTANGGVYGDGGVYALVPSNDPFAQSGPTLDLTFAGNPTDLLTASTTAGYTLNTFFTPETYQIAVPYAVWGANGLEQKNFSDIVTFTRASTGTYFNSAGTLTTAAINEARFDYNPSTLAAQGLLIEESRTNSIRNNTMVGAVAGTPGTAPTNWAVATTGGGVTREIVGTGTESGINYIDIRVSGTTTAALFFGIQTDGNTQVAALNGQNWNSTFYVRLVAGSLTNITQVNHVIKFNDAGGAPLTFGTGGIVPTSAALNTQRFSRLAAASNASTAFVAQLLQIEANSGAAIDITLRIGLPQLEQGAFATSVIPTTTTALTRSADVASVNTLSPWFNSVNGTLYVQGILVGGTNFPYQAALVGSNANNDSIGVNWTAASGQMRFTVRSGGVAQADVAAGSNKSAGSSYKVAGRYAANDFQAAIDGSLGTPDTSGSVPTITALSLGGPVSFQPGASVWLQRVTYYPRPLANADLQAITA